MKEMISVEVPCLKSLNIKRMKTNVKKKNLKPGVIAVGQNLYVVFCT